MSDRYQGFTKTPIGKLLVRNLGLPNPTRLERYTEGAPLVDPRGAHRHLVDLPVHPSPPHIGVAIKIGGTAVRCSRQRRPVGRRWRRGETNRVSVLA